MALEDSGKMRLVEERGRLQARDGRAGRGLAEQAIGLDHVKQNGEGAISVYTFLLLIQDSIATVNRSTQHLTRRV